MPGTDPGPGAGPGVPGTEPTDPLGIGPAALRGPPATELGVGAPHCGARPGGDMEGGMPARWMPGTCAIAPGRGGIARATGGGGFELPPELGAPGGQVATALDAGRKLPGAAPDGGAGGFPRGSKPWPT